MASIPLLLLLLQLLSSTALLATAPVPTPPTALEATDLTTCLASSGVTNFTISASSQEDATYAFYHILNFSIQNLRFAAHPKPIAIVLPSSQTELRNTIACLRRAPLSIRVRSGGHSYEGLSYLAENSNPFAVVDLMNINRVRVDPATRTAWVESGATLGETYYAIAAASGGTLAFSAGSCPTVGSGGHIAGGGFGLLSRKHGLAADNVIDALLVDSEGRVLDRESMGEDVFWAVRGGGGGCWGVVYAWRIQLVAVPERVTAFVVNRHGLTRRVAELVHKWQLVAPSLADEFYISVFVGAGLPELGHVGMSATFKGLYLGPSSEALEILTRSFPELKLTESELSEMSWIDSVVFFSGMVKGSSKSDLLNRELRGKTYFKAKSDYVRAPISKQDLLAAVHLLEKESKAYLILDPYGGAMSRIGSTDLPFPHRSGNLYAIQYLIEWKEEDNKWSQRYIQWLRGFYAYMGRFVSHGPRAAYVNYLDLDLGTTGSTDGRGGYTDPVAEARAWGEKYFLGNYDRLVRAKTAIDPTNVFNNAQSIPPLGFTIKSGEYMDEGGSVEISL